MEQRSIQNIMRLINMLMSSNNYTLNEIAEELEGSDCHISTRTAYRYLDSLKSAGYIVNCVDGKYSLGEDVNTKKMAKLLLVSNEEIVALNQIIDSLKGTAGFKKDLKHKMLSVLNIVSNTLEADKVQTIKTAISENKILTLKSYTSSSSSSKVSDRVVEPFKLVDNDTQVWCFEPSSMKNKIFKISRAKRIVLSTKPWEYAHLHQSKEIDVFNLTGEVNEEVSILLDNMARNKIIDDFPMSANCILNNDDENYPYRLETVIHSYLGLLGFALSMTGHIKLMKGAGFKAYFENFIKEQYGYLFK